MNRAEVADSLGLSMTRDLNPGIILIIDWDHSNVDEHRQKGKFLKLVVNPGDIILFEGVGEETTKREYHIDGLPMQSWENPEQFLLAVLIAQRILRLKASIVLAQFTLSPILEQLRSLFNDDSTRSGRLPKDDQKPKIIPKAERLQLALEVLEVTRQTHIVDKRNDSLLSALDEALLKNPERTVYLIAGGAHLDASMLKRISDRGHTYAILQPKPRRESPLNWVNGLAYLFGIASDNRKDLKNAWLDAKKKNPS